MILLLLKYTVVLVAVVGIARMAWGSAATRHLALALGFFSLPLIALFGELLPRETAFWFPQPVVVWMSSLPTEVIPAEVFVAVAEQRSYKLGYWAFYLVGAAGFLAFWIGLILRTHLQVSHHGRFMLRHGGLAVLSLDGIAIPFAWGVVRKVVVVPENFSEWGDAERGIALDHELAHHKRWDVLLAVASALFASLLWFHPLVWWARRKMLAEAERACDDQVLLRGHSPTCYAQILLSLQKNIRLQVAPSMASDSNLTVRITALLDTNLRRKTMNLRNFLTTSTLALMLAVPLSGLGEGGAVPSIKADVLSQLEKTQVLIKEEAYAKAQAELDLLREREDLNRNERGQVQNMIGYVHFLTNNYIAAIKSYELVVAQAGYIPAGLETTSMYTLAQLNFVEKNYEEAIRWMESWRAKAENPGPIPLVFMAQTLYEMKRYEEALERMEMGLAEAEARGSEIKPNWLQLRDYLKTKIDNPIAQTPSIGASTDGGVMLIAKVLPVYPTFAEREGLEGYVDLQYEVNATGDVVNIEVINSEPRAGVFDDAAVGTVAKYKYKPRVVNGTAVTTSGVQTRVAFELD
ncbi:MAG: TonB family protein [Pseudomonadales bacterium]|nr:TonB family protein [Pseudomonadales bacterium]